MELEAASDMPHDKSRGCTCLQAEVPCRKYVRRQGGFLPSTLGTSVGECLERWTWTKWRYLMSARSLTYASGKSTLTHDLDPVLNIVAYSTEIGTRAIDIISHFSFQCDYCPWCVFKQFIVGPAEWDIWIHPEGNMNILWSNVQLFSKICLFRFAF